MYFDIMRITLVFIFIYVFFFFFKQKTAYEMRISDWSSDVCSSDLVDKVGEPMSLSVLPDGRVLHNARDGRVFLTDLEGNTTLVATVPVYQQIGRASCRERVCQYV